nr:beta-1,6-N-acetylglucosaminyltransferase [Paenibacillus lactis]
MLAHNDCKHFGRLVRMLNDKADFYVHIDKKTSQSPFQSEVSQLSNVHFSEERYPVFWAGFNVIKATIALLHLCISSGKQYKKIVLLSGSDYPLVSNADIHAFFDKHPDIEFIRASNVSKSHSKHHLNHIQRYFLRDWNIRNKLVYKVVMKMVEMIHGFLPFQKKPFIEMNRKKFDIYMGSQWWALSQECVVDLLTWIEQYPGIDRYFKHSFAPDEKYFHTLIYNSPYRNKTELGDEEPFRTKEYKWPIWPNVHHIHPSLQKWYTADDADEVLSSDKLFVRKVNSSVSSTLLNRIDSRIKLSEKRVLKA